MYVEQSKIYITVGRYFCLFIWCSELLTTNRERGGDNLTEYEKLMGMGLILL